MGDTLVLSTLPKTWVFDLDGTLLKHNGYKLDGVDSGVPGAIDYLNTSPDEDYIVIFTSRTEEYREMTIEFLKKQGIRYDDILFNMPMGERIIVNDRKPSGLAMSIAINTTRDQLELPVIVREK